MSSIKKLLHRNGADEPKKPDVVDQENEEKESPSVEEEGIIDNPAHHAGAPVPPDGVPRDAMPVVALPPPPGNGNQLQSQGEYAGMMAGGLAGEMSGQGMVGTGVEGMVVGGMIGQRIHQAQNHSYWRQQALNYQAGAPAAGVGDPRVAPMPANGRERDRSDRDERRRKRWERRSNRY